MSEKNIRQLFAWEKVEREGLLQLCSGGIIKIKIEDCMAIAVHLVCGTLWGRGEVPEGTL